MNFVENSPRRHGRKRHRIEIEREPKTTERRGGEINVGMRHSDPSKHVFVKWLSVGPVSYSIFFLVFFLYFAHSGPNVYIIIYLSLLFAVFCCAPIIS